MKKFIFTTLAILLISSFALAQEKSHTAIAKDANNPLASIKSLSLHNIYSPSISGGMEGTMNTAWIRYAQPIGKVLIRASMPINTLNSGEINKSGLGDFNVFGTYILTKPTSPNQMGIGPILTIPTATSRSLGTGKWSVGVAFAGYFASNDTFQFGVLATWQFSFAGSSSRHKVNAASIQPFLMWQLKNGIYLRSTGNSILDFENGNYIVPIGLGIGKIIKINKLICNIFAEPQFNIWNEGSGLPKTQILIGCNTQF